MWQIILQQVTVLESASERACLLLAVDEAIKPRLGWRTSNNLAGVWEDYCISERCYAAEIALLCVFSDYSEIVFYFDVE